MDVLPVAQQSIRTEAELKLLVRGQLLAQRSATQYAGELAIICRRVEQIDNCRGELVPDLSAHQSAILLQLHDHQHKSENGHTIGCQRDRLYQSLPTHSPT